MHICLQVNHWELEQQQRGGGGGGKVCVCVCVCVCDVAYLIVGTAKGSNMSTSQMSIGTHTLPE